MTVDTTTRKVTFTMDGATVDFDFTFRTVTSTPTDIKCKTRVIATGVETDLTYTTDYTVSVDSDGVGGTVTVVDDKSSAYELIIYRELTRKQESNYDDYNQFPADTLETDLDRAVMIIQDIGEDVDRSLKLPISSTISTIEIPDGEANKVLGWDSTGAAIENKSSHTTSIALAKSYATTAAAEAADSATSATESSSHATTSATEATDAANSATTSSTQAIAAATSATTASSHATTAATSATTAASHATTAATYATTSTSSATVATSEATTAAAQAVSAATYATTATSSATVATSESTAAAVSAISALTYSTTASSHATTAATSATTATSSATVATSEATTATARVNAITSGSITFVIDGGGATITTGVKGFLEIPFACSISGVTLLANTYGSIAIDVWKDTYANFPPDNTDTITAGSEPTISTAVKAQDTDLFGWTTSIDALDILGFNVDSVTDVETVTLSINYLRGV